MTRNTDSSSSDGTGNGLRDLAANRLLRTAAECEAFERALEQIASAHDPKHLDDLHRVFDDESQADEVMFGLIHYLESFPEEEQMSSLFRVFDDIFARAKNWLDILHYRILNVDEARQTYRKLLRKERVERRKRICEYLQALGRQDPEFAERITEITRQLC